MKYYDIEIFNGSPTVIYEPSIGNWKKLLYDVLSEINSPNDNYFLKRLHKRSQKWDDPPNQWFYKILFTFYNHYFGDPVEWLDYTMNIIFTFDDIYADHWITSERENVKLGKLSPAKFLLQFTDYINNGKGTFEEKMLEISKKPGCYWKPSYLNKIRKEMDLDFPKISARK